jgi:hypothetical protein
MCFSTRQGKIVIRTDPANAQYVMYSGIRGKDESFSAVDNETIELLDADEKKRMATDALFKLEHGEKDKNAASAEHARIKQLYSIQERRVDDFAANQALRRQNRQAKKAHAGAMQAGAAKGLPFALAPAAAAGEMKDQEDDEMGVYRKRKALEDHATAQRRAKKQSKRSLGDMRSQPDSVASAAASISAPAASVTPVAVAASSAAGASGAVFHAALATPSFAPSSMMPLKPIHSKRPTVATPAAASFTDATAASSASSLPPSTHLLGLSAYDSD